VVPRKPPSTTDISNQVEPQVGSLRKKRRSWDQSILTNSSMQMPSFASAAGSDAAD
jgi:hypothetical protein